jgi:rhomboid protease GluP
MALSAALCLGYTGYILQTTPNDASTYDKTMAQFFKNQEKAMVLFTMPNTSTHEDYLREIRDNGLPAWRENLALLKTIQQLDVAPYYHERGKSFEEYSRLRVATYELYEKAYAENTNAYDSAIAIQAGKIDSVLQIINGE